MDAYTNIEQAAHDSAYGHNLRPTPSVAQQDAGNYKKGRASVAGIPVVIENPRGSQREWRAADGTSGANLMKFHYGYIEGVTGADGDELDCYVGPHPESGSAYVVNQGVNGAFDEHKVMLGFPDQRTAEAAYLSNFNAGWPGLDSCVACSIDQLKWWMANGDMSKPLTNDQLPQEEKKPMQKVLWDSANEPRGKTMAQVLYDIRAHDGADGLMFDPVCMADILADADGIVTLDALVVPYAKLPQRMAILQRVMNRKGGDLSAMSVQISDPFTQKGTTNVAAVFELSDGQTITIFFHNPDVTPKKIMATDDVVSWKWLLNKKDVTIVVAPERGRDLNIQNVAARVMTLAARNSPRFAQTNAKRAERMENIASLQKQYADGEATLAALNTEITELESAVALKKVTPVVKDTDQITPTITDVTDPIPDPVPLSAADAREAWREKMAAQNLPVVNIDGSDYYVLSIGATGEPGSEHDGQVFAHLASLSSGAVQRNGWYPSQINDWIADPSATVEPVIEPTPEPTPATPVAVDALPAAVSADVPFDDVGDTSRWLVMNAPRPLVGDMISDGPMLDGRSWALIDLTDSGAQAAIASNRQNGAIAVFPADQQTQTAMALNLADPEYLPAYLAMDAQELSESISGLLADLNKGKTYGELKALAAKGMPVAPVEPTPEPQPQGEPALEAAGFKNVDSNVWVREVTADDGRFLRININVADDGYFVRKTIGAPGLTGAGADLGRFDTADGAIAAAQAEFDAFTAAPVEPTYSGADVLEANGFKHGGENVWTRSQSNADGVKLALSAFIQPDGAYALRKAIVGLTDTGAVEDVGTYATPGELVDAANDAIEAFLNPVAPVVEPTPDPEPVVPTPGPTPLPLPDLSNTQATDAPDTRADDAAFVQSAADGNADFYDKAVTDRLASLASQYAGDDDFAGLIAAAKTATKNFFIAEFKKKVG